MSIYTFTFDEKNSHVDRERLFVTELVSQFFDSLIIEELRKEFYAAWVLRVPYTSLEINFAAKVDLII